MYVKDLIVSLRFDVTAGQWWADYSTPVSDVVTLPVSPAVVGILIDAGATVVRPAWLDEVSS